MTHEQREQHRFESDVRHWLAREFGADEADEEIVF